ncbi:hypothetical protein PLICRDRAFT_178022 [Plicaturopsis crispa FD-325 SS-3]|nr:hypothetical protein PLICRDRAFT_178022 [Plicaturopsis crispa FD-325 SS-3]
MGKTPTAESSARSSRKRSTAKASTSSPKSKKSKMPVPEPVDESKWRKSTISADTTINKSAAMAQYRLKSLDGVPLHSTEAALVSIPGKQFLRPMYLYLERDVERKAWEKHGGPAGFEAYLKKRYTSWCAKKTSSRRAFILPDAYRSNAFRSTAPSLSISSLPPSQPTPGTDPRVNSATMFRLKSRFPTWLWTACNEVLPYDEHTKTYRDAAFTSALRDLGPYPARPDKPSAPSASITILRDVLARAPSPATRDERRENLYVYDCPVSGNSIYYWIDEFSDNIFNALLGVIDEHGLRGPQGGECILWEVYDKYAECFGGIWYNGDRWVDPAKDWLRGHLEHRRRQASEAMRDHMTEVGKHYNDGLPVTDADGICELVSTTHMIISLDMR